MRIAFVVHWRGGARTGPFKKVVSQAREWTASGHVVGLFVATTKGSRPDWESADVGFLHIETAQGIAKLSERRRLARAALAWHPDLVYERHGLYYPGQGALARAVPLVVEVNGDDRAEMRLKSRTKCLYNALTRRIVLKSASGFVFVTQELSDRYSAETLDRPRAVIANGIRLEEVETAPRARPGAMPLIVFAGHPSTPWHGLEHVVELARYQPAWSVHIIGSTPDELPHPVPPNVTAHGEKDACDYRDVMSRAHVAVGALGLYREGLTEACSLKVREYLALGLPVILGCRDTDFPDGADFLCELPSAPTGVSSSLARIRDFVREWGDKRVPREAVRHLDVRAKEGVRLAFLAHVVERSETVQGSVSDT